MTTKSLPVKDLHKQLQGKTTTDKWDVLVSYSQTQLNEFLKKTWGASSRFTNVHLTQPMGHGKHAYTQVYDLKIHAPDLEFDTEHGYAYLTMPLSGKSYPEDDPTDIVEIKDGHYTFRVRVQIVGMKGDGSNTQTSGGVFHFEDGAKSSYYITFSFGTQNSNWQCIAANKDDEALNNEMHRVVTEAQSWFAATDNLQWIEYSMAEVSNTPHPSDKPSDNLLTPSSFVFSTQPGVLNVFIHTKGGTSGEGNPSPQFGLEHDQKVTPVPSEYQASIVISRELFLKTYLIENIKRLCTKLSSTDPVKSTTVDNGIKLELRYNQDKVIQCDNFHSNEFDQEFESLDVDMSSHPLTLTLQDDESDLSPKASWKWDFSGKVTYWQINHVAGHNSSFPLHVDVGATIEEHKRDFAQVKGDQVNVTVKFDDSDQPKTRSDHDNITGLIKLKLDAFDLDMPQLNYFRTQNIFAPGKEMINVKKLMLPYDLVLVGDINVKA